MQQSLFDVLAVPAEQLKYEAFKEANPWVMPALLDQNGATNSMHPRPHSLRHCSSCRSLALRSTQPPTTQTVNSNSTTITARFMAREIMQENPIFEGFFSTRKSVADLTEDY
jgi:hypothetical protein